MTHTKDEALDKALEAAYLAGFNASGEGYNFEHPFQRHNAHPEQDAGWVKGRDNKLSAIKRYAAMLHTPPAPVPLTDEQARDMPDCWVVVKNGQILATHDGPSHYDGIQAVRYAPAAQPEQPAPGMAVQAIAGEIIEALLADEKDGGYDLTAGMFGPAFSKLVRRWANAEWATNPPPAAPVPLTDEQRSKMYRTAVLRGDSIMVRGDYELGISDAEAAHGITKGQK